MEKARKGYAKVFSTKSLSKFGAPIAIHPDAVAMLCPKPEK